MDKTVSDQFLATEFHITLINLSTQDILNEALFMCYTCCVIYTPPRTVCMELADTALDTCGTACQCHASGSPLDPDVNQIYVPSHSQDHDPVPLKAGWGKCWVQWCNCQEFVGNDRLCANCGHPYDQHYG